MPYDNIKVAELEIAMTRILREHDGTITVGDLVRQAETTVIAGDVRTARALNRIARAGRIEMHKILKVDGTTPFGIDTARLAQDSFRPVEHSMFHANKRGKAQNGWDDRRRAGLLETIATYVRVTEPA
jgi:hypothetical protein